MKKKKKDQYRINENELEGHLESLDTILNRLYRERRIKVEKEKYTIEKERRKLKRERGKDPFKNVEYWIEGGKKMLDLAENAIKQLPLEDRDKWEKLLYLEEVEAALKHLKRKKEMLISQKKDLENKKYKKNHERE